MEVIIKGSTELKNLEIIQDDLIRCALEELRKRAEEKEQLATKEA